MARLPKNIIKKYGITKKAWRIFKGRKRKSPTRRTRTHKYQVWKVRRKNPGRKRGVRRMGKKKRRGGKSIQRTAFKLIRLGALAAPGVFIAMKPISSKDKVNDIITAYTGYSPRWGDFRFERLLQGWGAYLGAVLTTYGIPKLTGIIRKL